jgi:DNA-binding GntR family transcriptional regulator
MIVSSELPPAALLDEQGFAGLLGVGLTPVRHALRRLE